MFINEYVQSPNIIAALPKIPLRTLDALHLSIVQYQLIPCLATADVIMAKAVKALGLNVRIFSSRRE